MKLPNAEAAVIPERKLTHYLLSETHEDGRGKAAFFRRMGFSLDHWQELSRALLTLAATNDVTQEAPTSFGTSLVVEGIMVTPSRRQPMIRTVWHLDAGSQVPRFVTAYPI